MSKSFNPISMFTGGDDSAKRNADAQAAAQAAAAQKAAADKDAADTAAAEKVIAEKAAADKATADAATAAEAEKKKKQGALSAGGTILTGSLGLQDENTGGQKTLLGT
jgi:FKBP-type peptidyl-prolyl cis-trans isomerase